MRTLSKNLGRCALLCAALGSLPFSQAASTASVSVSDSVATSVGSASTSLNGSSNSVSGRDKVAEGDYQIIMATAVNDAANDAPAMMRLTLQATGGDAAPLILLLPQATWAHSRLATGHRVSAWHRPYGLEFTQTPTRRAFFLVLDDAWYRELQSRPVVL